MTTIDIDILSEHAVIEQPVELTILTVSGHCHSVSALSTWSVHIVKEAVSGLTSHLVDHQRLLFGSRVLRNTEILQEFLPANQTHHEMLLIISIDEEKANIVTSLMLGRVGLASVDHKYREDLYVVEAAVRKDGLNLEYARGEARKDKTIVFAAVAQNGFALSFAPREFSFEPDVVLAGVRSNAFAMTLAAPSLQASCEFAIKAIHANPFVRDYIDSQINLTIPSTPANIAGKAHCQIQQERALDQGLESMDIGLRQRELPLNSGPETNNIAAPRKGSFRRWLVPWWSGL